MFGPRPFDCQSDKSGRNDQNRNATRYAAMDNAATECGAYPLQSRTEPGGIVNCRMYTPSRCCIADAEQREAVFVLTGSTVANCWKPLPQRSAQTTSPTLGMTEPEWKLL